MAMRHFLSLLTILSVLQIASAQQFGRVSGRVISQQSGEPLHYTYILVKGTGISTLSDTAGYYELPRVPLGYQQIIFNNFGHIELESEPIMVTVANEITLDIELEKSITDIAAVVVTARSLRRSEVPPVGVKKLNIEEIERAPGTGRDISKAVQNLPGVAAQPVSRNDLIVRGGGPNENKFFLDRIEIPVLNHFQTQGASGGNASIVNSDFLSGATLYTSAFPAARGGALSSVLDLQLKEGNSKKFLTKFSIGGSDLALTFDTPINDKSSLIASYRISYLQFLFAALKLPILPTYQDAQFKYVYKFDKSSSLKILGLGSLDKNRLNLDMDEIKPSLQQLLDFLPENDQWSYVVGAVYNRLTNKGSLDVIVSHNQMSNRLNKWLDNNYDSLQTLRYSSIESELKARVEYTQRLEGGYTLSYGISGDMGWYSADNNQIIFFEDNRVADIYNSKLSVFNFAAYSTINKRFFDDKLRVMFALRADGNSYNETMRNPLNQLSPRLSASWEFAKGWSLNGNIGRYFQEPTYTTLGYRDSEGVLVNRDRLEYIGSNQLTMGIEYKPDGNQRVVLEAFYKGYDSYPMSLVDSTAIGSAGADVFAVGAEPVASIGKARSCGLEVSYRNDDLWGARIFTTYTYFVSKYAKLGEGFRVTDNYISTNWDYRHLFNFLASKDLGDGWEVGLRWRFAGGAPYTPYDVDLSSNIGVWETNGRPVLDYELTNTERLPSFHQLDIRVDKMWSFKRWTLGLYLDIQNLYNYQAYGQDILLPEVDLNGNYIEDPNRAGHYILKSYENSIGGTVLPTFGVIIEF